MTFLKTRKSDQRAADIGILCGKQFLTVVGRWHQQVSLFVGCETETFWSLTEINEDRPTSRLNTIFHCFFLINICSNSKKIYG